MKLTRSLALGRFACGEFLRSVVLCLGLALLSGVGTLQAQAYRGGTQTGPSFDDIPVIIYRMVILESRRPLVEHGAQFSEADFSTRLQQWRTSGSADVVVDKGFILPEGAQAIDPNFSGAGGRAIMMGAQDNRSPGPAMRLKSARTAEGFHSEVKLSVWAMAGQSLKDSLATLENPAMVAGSAPVSSQGPRVAEVPCQQGPEVQHAWDSALRTVTALVCQSGEGAGRYCNVFLNPISSRPSWIDQPGLPKQYKSADLRMVGGAVPSSTFWSYIKNTRPDIIRPKVMGGGILELFWSDTEWQTFTDMTKQAGTAWANLPDARLSVEKPSIKLNSPQMNVSISLASELPSQGYLLKLDCPTMTSESGGTKITGDQFGISLPALCESHQHRWTIFARLAGNVTYLLAFRPQFEEAANVEPARAVAVPDALPGGMAATPEISAPAPVAPLPEPKGPPPLPEAPPMAPVPAAQALQLYAGEWQGTIYGRPNARMRLSCMWDEKRQELTRDTKIDMEPGYSRPILNTTVLSRDPVTGAFKSRMVPTTKTPPAIADGEWDGIKRTFTWSSVDKRTGSRMVTTAMFPLEGVMEWRQVLIHSSGEEAVNEGGRSVRVKR